MTKNTYLLGLVSVASFAIGMAVDRVVSPARGSGAQTAMSSKGAPKQKTPPNGRTIESSRESGPSQAGRTGQASRQGSQSTDREKDPVPRSVREALQALERGGPIDAQTANRLLGQVPAGRARRHVLHRIAHHWARQDPESAAAWASELEGALRHRALEGVLHGWSEEDPAGAANYVVQLPTSEQILHLVHAMAYRWGERDQVAAMKWGNSLTNPAHRERAIGGVVSSWSDTDPEGAAEFAASIESYYERRRVLEVAARRWATHDTSEAMEWARNLPEADRGHTTRSILRELAERDPRRAATIYDDMTGSLADEPQGTHDHRRMAEEIASVWSSSSPREAAEWAVGLPETGEVQRSAVRNVAEHWLRIDSMAAGEWILQLPEGSTRDAAAERVVGSTVRSDPAAAFEWANSISDDGHRHGLIRQVMHRWRSTDTASAQAALNNANLTPQQRHELNGLFADRQAPQPNDGE